MAFSMRNFVKQGLLKSVGKQADYLIIRNAAGWHEKGVLELSDLEEIQNALNAQGNIMGDVTQTLPAPETVREIPPTDEETSEASPEAEDVTQENPAPETVAEIAPTDEETSEASPETKDVTQEKPTPETVAEIPPTDEETSGLEPESGGVTDE